jgi:hypothetical protein
MTFQEWRHLAFRWAPQRIMGAPATMITAAGTAWIAIAVLGVGDPSSERRDVVAVIAQWVSLLAFVCVVAATLALLVPREREVAAYRRRCGQCVRCRYEVMDCPAGTCPECGSPQS